MRHYGQYAKWHRQKDASLSRDHYTCQLCGSTANLRTHHKDGKGWGAGLQVTQIDNTLPNLTTLCAKCHSRLHRDLFGKYAAIHRLRAVGGTLERIGQTYGVSRQRIHQLLNK